MKSPYRKRDKICFHNSFISHTGTMRNRTAGNTLWILVLQFLKASFHLFKSFRKGYCFWLPEDRLLLSCHKLKWECFKSALVFKRLRIKAWSRRSTQDFFWVERAACVQVVESESGLSVGGSWGMRSVEADMEPFASCGVCYCFAFV